MFKFLTKNLAKVFGKNLRRHYLPPANTVKKMKGLRAEYAKIHHEYFLFKKGKTIVGWSYGEMDDFETFYMRSTGLLPEYRKRMVYSEFLGQFVKYAHAMGYQRVSSHHHPDNLAVISVKLKSGFFVAGTENHERWGQLLKMVKILDPERDKFFKKKFF